MSSRNKSVAYFYITHFTQYNLLPIAVLLFISLAWYTMNRQEQALIETNIAAYQQTELEIVRAAARSVESFVHDQTEFHDRTDMSEIEQEIFKQFIAPIHLLENGDAWIYAPDHVVFDLSADFPDDYRSKSMAEIFAIQEINGASHFEEMSVSVMEGREGVGWYVWLPEKGREIAAWTPVWVGEYVWTIGLSTPLPEILESTGATGQIRTMNTSLGIGTAITLVMLLLWHVGAMKRQQAEKAIQKAHDESEIRVVERTEELATSNEQLAERVQEMNTLYEMMVRTTLSVHLEEILQHTLDAINETIEADNIAILLIEEETNELVIRAYSGFGDGPKLIRRALGVGIPGIVAQTGETIMLPDVREHEGYHACDTGARSEICVPLQAGNQILGSLNLESREIDAFSNDDLRLLSILANNLAIIIKNAQLYEDTVRLKEYSENIVRSVNEAIIFEDKEGCLTFANPAAESLLGYTQKELDGIHWTKIFPESQHENIQNEMKQNDICSYESEIITKEQKIVPVIVSGRALYSQGKYNGNLATLIDITQRVQIEDKLRQYATTDYLTGIFNRRHFFELAEKELERSQRYDRPLSIIIFDIDHFKNVNDTYGHGVGDKVLCSLTADCQDSLRENDVFARFGGEEFVILLPEADLEQARQMAERIRTNCAGSPIDVGAAGDRPDAAVSLTVSFGVASLGNENLLIDELLRRADKALYEAKEAGRNRVRVWGR